MKRNVLLLFSFLNIICASAQTKSGIICFDFTNPTLLTPSVTPASGQGSEVSVSSFTSTDGYNTVDFTVEKGTAAIKTSESNGQSTYVLSLSNSTIIKFAGVGKVKLDSIRMTGKVGSIGLYTDESGYMDPALMGQSWVSNNETVSSVQMKVGNSAARIKTANIYYSVPSMTAVPTWNINENTVNSGDTVQYINDISLEFGSAISGISASGIQVTSNGVAQTLSSAKYDGKTATLSLASPISEKADVSVTVPAGCISLVNGYSNKALSYTFTVVPSKATFIYTSYQYQDEVIDTLKDGFVVTFPQTIGHLKSSDIVIFGENNTPISVVTPEIAGDDNNQIRFVYKNNNTPITEKGTYMLTVKEKSVYNNFYEVDDYERWNPEFILTYTIGEKSDSGTDPDEPENPDTPTVSDEVKELIETANDLLAKTDVGYPSTDSESYTALKTLVDTVDENTTAVQLTTAINNLYAETSINLPEAGSYYTIAAVNSANKKLYVKYSEGSISLSESADDAAKFVAVDNANGKTTLKTLDDGKYLHVLSISSAIYKSTTAENVTDSYNSEVNDLTFGKFDIGGVDANNTFGLVSMYGGLGTNASGKEGYASALIDFSSNAIITDPSDQSLLFTETSSSAFVLSEVDKSDVTVTLNPTVTTSSNYTSLTVSFVGTDVTTISVNESATEQPYILVGTTKKTVSLVASAINTFTVSLGSMTNGTYTLVIPKGVLICEKGGNELTVDEITKSFKINNPDLSYQYNFPFFHGKIVYSTSYYDETYLNDWIITSSYEIEPDPNMVVELQSNRSNNNPIRKGVFEKTSMTSNGMYAIVLKYIDGTDNYGNKLSTEPLKSGELDAGYYRFVFQNATFGDSNFGKYINGDSSVLPADCRVNVYRTLSINIDSTKASGIESIEMDATGEKVIYDITGRKLQSADKPGLYIINGKKVVVK